MGKVKKIAVGIGVIISIIGILFVIDISIKLGQINAEHEKYGKDIGMDYFGNTCAMSQMDATANNGRGECDYSKPVKDLEHKTTQEPIKDLKWKAENLLKAHNDLVNFNKIRPPDPVDYGFDLDVGFTDNVKKDEWCGIVLEHKKKMFTLMVALENALNWLAGESEQPVALQERVAEDERLKNDMYESSAKLKNVIIDFDC